MRRPTLVIALLATLLGSACVEVYGSNLTNSGWVEQSTCHNAPPLKDNQVWTVTWGHL
ncbi:hypothetical protein [Micromonospora sp. NPDC093277]|uniref:hypothetical protein n=1 Tax=Micromonospora sp. NPDC093277 TaxID=3364291 RepID=UPI00381FC06B